MTTQSKSTHRGAGEGTIYKDTARNRWVAQVTVGYDGRTGRLIRRSKSARTRKEARQIVTHGHITVNGRRVDVPSYRVRPGDLVAVAPKSKDLLVIKSALVSNERFEVPAWLEVDIEKLQGSVLALPERDQIDLEINEQLIVELYSK